jgi:acetyl/propionyl-CoA carboxylase alpha subunit/acetyl-CoA carboxylase carboxyltransferase component
MTPKKILIANRGEVAIRIARAAAELGVISTAVYATDDARALHVCKADEAHPLTDRGAAAYLDMDALIAVAHKARCEAVHPGYGFLSESAGFARRCAQAGLVFVGPQPEVLEQLGDKTRARALARLHDVPVVAGTEGAASLEQVRDFLGSLGAGAAIMLKAVAGGGGRGMRMVHHADDLEQAYLRCRSEAKASFGHDAVYAEQLVRGARHIEVQIVGDGTSVSHLWERECTLQRRNQKLVEFAPSPGLEPCLRGRILAAAVSLAQVLHYRGLGTFEFLVEGDAFWFMEANPRLQVEHTVTEEITGIDLVKAQLQIAGGSRLAQLGLEQDRIESPRGHALQLRINMEVMQADGSALPASGTLFAFEPPGGPGVRVDSCGYPGYTANPAFDSLLAKVIVRQPSGSFSELIARAYRALSEFRIEGLATNLGFLQNLLCDPDVLANRVHTRFIDARASALLAHTPGLHSARYFAAVMSSHLPTNPMPPAALGTLALTAPMPGLLVSMEVSEGDMVATGQQVAVVEAMKMEHVIRAECDGIVRGLTLLPGALLAAGQPLAYIEPVASGLQQAGRQDVPDLEYIPADLAEALERHAIGQDAARPEAVAKRRKTGQRTARENIADLCDDDSFIEYGALAIAAQRRRRSLDELIRISPADGLVAGIGSINGALFDDRKSRCMVLSYDYTVFAGTQGMMNHKKTDRMFQVAQEARLPIVLFAEGGGGRPGDTDAMIVAGLDVMSFINFAKLSGLVPRIGIVSGRCFAGNAALLGCCDVIIATENATVGMGGPAMIEGGGLGVYEPEQVGPVSMQAPNGVLDIVVKDEPEAVHHAKRYLSYFQGTLSDWHCADQRNLRHLIPENRLRVYDVHSVIEVLADSGSVLELRAAFGIGIVTALVRIEGKPFGLLANNPIHLGGAIDADAADKAARFMQLCDAFDLPLVSLCDTPGFMVGPDAEKTAMVRHVSRMFVTAGSLSVPVFAVVLRKGYGLGAQAMAGGSFHAPMFTAAWPCAEFGGMGLEGAVRLGFRKELEALAEGEPRKALFDKLVAEYYEKGKAINMASFLEIDSVIDPAETRRWVIRGLRSMPPVPERTGKKRFIDTW